MIAGVLHEHLLGRAAQLRIIRDGKELEPLLVGEDQCRFMEIYLKQNKL